MIIQRTAEVSKVSEHSYHNFGNKKRKQEEIDETGNLKFQVLGSLRSLHKQLLTHYSVEEDSKFTVEYFN